MDRETLVNKLKEDLAVGRVVIVVGTGVSVAACGNQEIEGFCVATWPGLLKHGIKHCKDIGVADANDAELLTMQVQSGKTNFLIAVAEDISHRMRGRSDGVFRGWLKDTVGKLSITNREVLDAVTEFPGVLATLNYDSLLEEATGRRTVTWKNTDEVQEILTGIVTDAVLHLHGSYREPDSVVLGLSSYSAVRDHPHAREVLRLFTIDHTLLFVGCGDTVEDPNFLRLIEWAREALRDVAPRHYLLCRTSELPEIQQKLAHAPWLQPLDYGTDYANLAPFLRSLLPVNGAISPSKQVISTAALRLDLAAYKLSMRKKFGRLKLEELDPTSHDVRPLQLTGMYIGQSARECLDFMPRLFELPKELQLKLRETGELQNALPDGKALKELQSAYLNQSPRPILEFITDPDFTRLVILGDPGSGKSTLLQYLVLDWAEKASPDVTQHPLPLLIELREYGRLRTEGSTVGFLEYLHQGETVRSQLHEHGLKTWLENYPSQVLFDGLDEVFDLTLRKEISTAIARFADSFPNARVIVTSRVIGFQQETWRDEKFRQVMLEDLEEAQIDAFLNRWHRAAYEDATKGESRKLLLTRAVRGSPAIRQLAGNPLLLTMMAILNRTQELPRDRGELYEQCARLLLHQWKVEIAFSTDKELDKASLDFKDKRGLMLRVAKAMQTNEHGLAGNLIDECALEQSLAGGLEGIPLVRSARAARALIEQLRGRNFMLCSLGAGTYAFVHRTFLEYFCAVEIRERFQTEQSLSVEQLKVDVFGHWREETWHEVLCLLVSMLSPRFVTEILDWLLMQDDPEKTFHHLFLAAKCIGEVRKRGELGPVDNIIREAIVSLADIDIAHLGYFMEGYEKMRALRCRAIEIFATIWRDWPNTRSWLQQQVQSDRDYLERSTAVQQLARGWRDDPQMFPWLKGVAQSDGHRITREVAVVELVRGWTDDPKMSSWLEKLAQADDGGFVHRMVVRQIERWSKVTDAGR